MKKVLNLEENLILAKNAAVLAGDYLKNLSSTETLSEIGRDIKLQADREAEKIILDVLQNTPYKTLSEESLPNTKNVGVRWIVDPLDGSLNFSRGIPNCCVSISLWKNKDPLLGVVYDFNRNDMYSGTKDIGSFLNEDSVFVSSTNKKEKAIICTGFPSGMEYTTRNLSKLMREIKEFKKPRMLGSAALSLAYVASGKVDVYHERGIRLWDVAAGLALVNFAAGHFNISKLESGKYDVFASNGLIKKD